MESEGRSIRTSSLDAFHSAWLRSSQHHLPRELRRTRGAPPRVPVGGAERPEIVAVEVVGQDPFNKQASKQEIQSYSALGHLGCW